MVSSRAEKLFEMPVADVYVHYVNKVRRKDRTEAELIEVIKWLTGFDSKTLMKKIRYMDKLVDELAQGRPMEKILRSDL